MCECDQISRMENNDFSFCKHRVRQHLTYLCLAAGGCSRAKETDESLCYHLLWKAKYTHCMQKVLSSSPVLCLV